MAILGENLKGRSKQAPVAHMSTSKARLIAISDLIVLANAVVHVVVYTPGVVSL